MNSNDNNKKSKMLSTSTTLSTSLFSNFVDSIKSEATKDRYVYGLNRYIRYLKYDSIEQLIETETTKLIEANIIQYIVWLRQDQRISAAGPI
jgi:hypothetical protein